MKNLRCKESHHCDGGLVGFETTTWHLCIYYMLGAFRGKLTYPSPSTVYIYIYIYITFLLFLNTFVVPLHYCTSVESNSDITFHRTTTTSRC